MATAVHALPGAVRYATTRQMGASERCEAWVEKRAQLHFFPKKLEILFMPFLLTLARLLCAWLMGCFAFAAAAAASAFVCAAGPRHAAKKNQ